MQEEEGFRAVVKMWNYQWAADSSPKALLQICRVGGRLTGEREGCSVQCGIVRRIVNCPVRLIDVEAAAATERHRASPATAATRPASRRATCCAGNSSLLAIAGAQFVRIHTK